MLAALDRAKKNEKKSSKMKMPFVDEYVEGQDDFEDENIPTNINIQPLETMSSHGSVIKESDYERAETDMKGDMAV